MDREVHGTSLRWSERSSNALFMAAVFSGVRGSSHSPRSLAAAAKMSCKTFAESETSAFVFLTTASTIRITVCAKHIAHEDIVGARDVLGHEGAWKAWHCMACNHERCRHARMYACYADIMGIQSQPRLGRASYIGQVGQLRLFLLAGCSVCSSGEAQPEIAVKG